MSFRKQTLAWPGSPTLQKNRGPFHQKRPEEHRRQEICKGCSDQANGKCGLVRECHESFRERLRYGHCPAGKW